MNTRARYIVSPLRLLVAAAALSLSACTTIDTIDNILTSKARVDYKQNYEFDDIRRVSVACGMDLDNEDTPVSRGQVDRINEALVSALEGRGMTVVQNPDEADASVSWHVVAKEQSNVRAYNAEAYYQCWRCGPAISSKSEVTYTQGTFIVDIIDNQLSESVWRGVIQGRLADLGDSGAEQQGFDKAAREMFAKFPPGILIDGIY